MFLYSTNLIIYEGRSTFKLEVFLHAVEIFTVSRQYFLLYLGCQYWYRTHVGIFDVRNRPFGKQGHIGFQRFHRYQILICFAPLPGYEIYRFLDAINGSFDLTVVIRTGSSLMIGVWSQS